MTENPAPAAFPIHNYAGTEVPPLDALAAAAAGIARPTYRRRANAGQRAKAVAKRRAARKARKRNR